MQKYKKQKDLYTRRLYMIANICQNNVNTNPSVGSFIDIDRKVVCEDYHRKFGGPHSEVNTIQRKNADVHLCKRKDLTIYVSLEPCNHNGKTPPCTDLIIKNEIENCMVTRVDPNSLMQGKSLELLKSKGINTSLISTPKRRDELRFEKNITQKLPYVILKFAESSDHFLDQSGSPVEISNSITSILVHKWRSESDGILIGKRTLINDNPKLTIRNYFGTNPLRIVLSQQIISDIDQFEIAIDENYLNLISKTLDADGNQKEKSLQTLLEILYSQHNIGSIFVEGGSETIQKFIDMDLWDEIRSITNTELKLEAGTLAPTIKNAIMVDSKRIKNDEVRLYYNKKYLLNKF